MLNAKTINDFIRITNFDILDLFQDFTTFIQVHYPFVLSYYNGDSSIPNMNSFNLLNSLITKSNNCLQQIHLHKKSLNNLDFWDLLEEVETINTKINTISNLPLYLRSYIDKNQFKLGTESEIPLKQNFTIENFVSEEMGSIDPNNDWVDTAMYNRLREEDYDRRGGTLLKAFFPQDTERYFLNSVLGKLKGELLYGIDIKSQLAFVNDDIDIDTPKDTMRNAITRYINLKRGDNPEFPNDGIQSSLYVGSTIGSFLFPVLFRQLVDIFKKDDTIASFRVTNIKNVNDSVFIEYEIQTKYGEVYQEKQKLA